MKHSFYRLLCKSITFCLVPAVTKAQITADPSAAANQRATVLQTANAIPQVNIQTPSSAGVSRNSYSQFDVQRNGVILNNARTATQTQIGGWVQGNPWLSAGSAKVILNEVNSSHPSQLKGYIEVAGPRAEVVIANPAGIHINGGGFINASKATLTTGTPTLNQSQIDNYRVLGGSIAIDGAGLHPQNMKASGEQAHLFHSMVISSIRERTRNVTKFLKLNYLTERPNLILADLAMACSSYQPIPEAWKSFLNI